jgi:hypothetical protein
VDGVGVLPGLERGLSECSSSICFFHFGWMV